MERGIQLLGFNRHRLKALREGFVSNRRNTLHFPDTMLGDHIRDPEILIDWHNLYGSQSEVILLTLLIPLPKRLSWFGPAPRESENEPFAPCPHIIANVRDDFGPATLRGGSIAANQSNRKNDFYHRLTPG